MYASPSNVTGNRVVVSHRLQARPYLRPLALGWYSAVEDYHADAESGTRFLIRREHSVFQHQDIVIDYLTERVPYGNRYGGWEHVTVAYLESESSPYPFHYDLHDAVRTANRHSVAEIPFLRTAEPQQRHS